MLKLQVTAWAGRNSPALLYDSETTRALLKNKPMTLEMNELNGNEKYFDLPVSLPAEARNPHSIRAGDLKPLCGERLPEDAVLRELFHLL
ncbi:MAG: cyclophilin-like fold protein [Oscillospiraceae bacterium]